MNILLSLLLIYIVSAWIVHRVDLYLIKSEPVSSVKEVYVGWLLAFIPVANTALAVAFSAAIVCVVSEVAFTTSKRRFSTMLNSLKKRR